MPSPQLLLCPSYVISESPPAVRLNIFYYNQLLPCLSLSLDCKCLEDRGKAPSFTSMYLMHGHSGCLIIIFGPNMSGKQIRQINLKNLTAVLIRMKWIAICKVLRIMPAPKEWFQLCEIHARNNLARDSMWMKKGALTQPENQMQGGPRKHLKG